MKFEIGKTVGGYEFLDYLGSSKVDVSYKVRNILAQRIELLRVLPKQDDPDLTSRFLREMKVHARLVHPNIVWFYDARELEGQLVMTTEFVEGNTLRQRIEGGPMSAIDASGYICQALVALGYAHAQRVVHRDITPECIIVTPEGTVKLTCFGVAKSAADPNLTQAGAVRGALKYLSPEQVRGTSGVDVRTDIYSLGAVLYELVTGKPPFDLASEFDIMLAQVNTIPPPPSALNPQIPREFDKVVLTAMAKEPNQRFQTADEFRDALENVNQAGTNEVLQPRPDALQISARAEAVASAAQPQSASLALLSSHREGAANVVSGGGAASCARAPLTSPFLSSSFNNKPGFLVALPNWDRAQLTFAGIIVAAIVLLAILTVVR